MLINGCVQCKGLTSSLNIPTLEEAVELVVHKKVHAII